MCSGSDNPPEFMDVTRPKARKQHRCCECGLPIPVGEVYIKSLGKWDGDFGQYVQHVACHELLQWISDQFCGGEMWSFGELRQELSEYRPEHFSAEREPDLRALAVTALERWAIIQGTYSHLVGAA